jgi:FAD/FMN-containing dehydrogenase/Fe-S oxidoreductase
VEPGLVLDDLNRFLKPHGLFFPVDVSTSSRATIGGMAGNNSCGTRSIRYGNMVHNVREIEALLADGIAVRFGESGILQETGLTGARYRNLIETVRAIGKREAEEIAARIPKLLRRVGGYNLDAISQSGFNTARLLVGSEGTLAFFNRLRLDLRPIPPHRVLGACHFPTFYQAMDATQHIVKLDPSAVELIDRTMIELSRDIELYRPTVERFVRGAPDALLLVEFAGDDRGEQSRRLKQLVELVGTLGFPGSVVEATDEEFQKAIWEVRKSGLNIMMSMKGDGKPVSFIEDCAVRLEDLADYTERLTKVFHKYGTTGTWYAHASVGCLHVRPILNMKSEAGARKMRAIMEEALALVREYKGSHSGEHGDGLARSEHHEAMFGPRLVRAFEEVKDAFDPAGLFNPGKIVRAPRMDDRRLFRYRPGYAVPPIDTVFNWSDWGGFGGAVEMCNNNGACRKAQPGVMCPSYRVTQDEKHVTRGRANSLRLALSGQLGPAALVSEAMFETMDLCVSCKACKLECPTGVDMAKMKIEFLNQYRRHHRLRLRERLVAYLPRYGRFAARAGFLLNMRDRLPGMPYLSEMLLGLSRHRSLPQWRPDWFNPAERQSANGELPHGAPEVALWVDTFNTYFEPENARAALAVLNAAGYRVHLVGSTGESRPLCCGRTFLTTGLIEEARAEAERSIAALTPFVARGISIIGLEPSCLLTLRDEYPSLLPGDTTRRLADQALLFEEFLAREYQQGNLRLRLKPIAAKLALLHGHCHQKAMGTFASLRTVLGLIPQLDVKAVESSCCGMAGAFGFEAEHYEISMKMAELSLLPAIRAADAATVLIANGTSCRHQIHDGARRQAVHVARALHMALKD